MFRAELIKLKRSAVWVTAPILPLLAVFTGTLNVVNNPDSLVGGWDSLTSQVTLFYSLMFFSVGIALLTATAWRVEHRGSNGNLLLTNTRRPMALVLAKIAAILVPVAAMQLLLVAGTLLAGLRVLDLSVPVPWGFAVAGALAVFVAVPLVAVQSLLSMLLRSFAAPVAICVLGCVAGLASVLSPALNTAAYVLPQALVTRALTLGSSAIAGSGSLSITDAMPLALSAGALSVAVVALSVLSIRRIVLR